MDLWDGLMADTDGSVKLFISSPMGVGKSYILFLVTMAYSQDWSILYILNGTEFHKTNALASSEVICSYFFVLNWDILTASELPVYNTNDKHFWMDRASAVIIKHLQPFHHKTLLFIDEYGKLFENPLPT
ncbi:3860_t:CDS:1 [Paraglomus brasilianum]|uniref:3860_t:CDS:1 n=1 Tax=Paraglomus brasilianum TaxID=144538 RepID=A0A9N9BQD9_9GLOM|nr:3860_t:CDS:1 [Paraglomus brasilianum]